MKITRYRLHKLIESLSNNQTRKKVIVKTNTKIHTNTYKNRTQPLSVSLYNKTFRQWY